MSLMPQTPFQWLVSATTGDGQVPASGYLVKFYSAGTATPKTIYTNFLLTVPYASPSNTAELDADGRALIYLGSGGYKMVVCEPDGTPVYTQDNIQGEGNFGTGFVDSYADLVDVNTALNAFTYIGGYYAPGDGGEGMFYNATSVAATDGGYVQESDFDPTKRWFRIPDENGDVRAASFGYIPATAGDQTSALLAADSYAFINSARLRIQAGGLATITTLTLTAPTVVFNQSAGLLGAVGTVNLLVNGIIEAGGWQLFNNIDAIAFANAKIESRPEWFGASLSGSGAANATAFAAMVGAGGGVFVIPPGTWTHTGTFTPSASAITIFLGTVGTRIPGTYYAPASLISGNLSLTLTGTYGLTGNLTVTGDISGTGNFTRTGNIILTGGITASGTITANAVASVTNVSAGTSISAVTNISAGTSISAGDTPGVDGYVQARAGTSTAQVFKASGSGQVTLGTGSASLAANSLTATGDYIKIIFSGTTTSTNPTIAVTVGAATVFSCATLTTGSGGTYTYYGEVLVFRAGATTSYSTGFVNWNAVTTTLISAGTSSASAAVTWANVNAIAHTATATNNRALTMYEIYPAP
jgi:hypothetical protein